MRVRHYGSIDSTMAEADRLIAAGLEEATVLIADEQTGGHGRYGRVWHSPPGNLYWTAVVPLDANAPLDATIALFTALAVVDTAVELGVAPADLLVKWPNDTLLREQKVSGVLIKRSCSAGEESRRSCLVVGIGINVATAPAGVAFPATSLRSVLSQLPSPREIGQMLGACFAVRLEQWKRGEFAARRAEYEQRLYRLGQPIELSFDRDRKERLHGIHRGVDEQGALRLELDDGSLRIVSVGEVMPS